MIYLLSEDLRETARMLDDKALDWQIKAVAQALCNAHYFVAETERASIGYENYRAIIDLIPLTLNEKNDHYTAWTSECRANYDWLVEMALACCEECIFRYNPQYTELYNDKIKIMQGVTIQRHRLHSVIEWARDNAPDLCGNYELKPVECDGMVLGYRQEPAPTPFPLVMPEQYYSDALKIGSDLLNYDGLRWQTIISYRNYYRARIKKSNQCDGCKSGVQISKTGMHIVPYPSGGMRCQRHEYLPKWTRRPIPEFLEGTL
jgi:hypothetical protein